MVKLNPVTGAYEDVRRALPAALDAKRPLALGFVPDATDTVPDGTAVVIATSGSTGIPKRVVLSATALRASAEATAATLGSGSWVLALPTDYIAGLQVVVRSVLAGTEPVRVAGQFTPDAFVAATHEATGAHPLFTSLVPAQLATVVDAAEEDERVRAAASAFSAILVGGQATPLPLRERAAALGIKVVRTYGSTETSGGCVYDGYALEGVSIRSFDGELRISGPTLADGYLGDREQTERVFAMDELGTRWYRTGDLGKVADGLVTVTGRIDRVIISGGVNVSLDLVERVIREVPGLEEAVVAGTDDQRWGQASVVYLQAPKETDAAGLLAKVRARVGATLGAAARPREVRVIGELPLLPSGKPDRDALG
jgi:O-succinylbenzoic acid--CoA ligase